MGAQTSVNISKQSTNVVGKASQKCAESKINQITDIDLLDFECPEWCGSKDCSLNITQDVAVEADCVLNTAVDMAASNLAQSESKVQGGFGIQTNWSETEIKQNIENQLNSECGNTDSSQIQRYKTMKVKACNMNLMQNMSAQTQCKLATMQKLAADAVTKIKSETEGASLASLLGFGSLGLFVVLLIGGGAYYAYSSQDGGLSDSIFDTSMIGGTITWTTWILIAVVIVLIIISYGTQPKQIEMRVGTPGNPTQGIMQSNQTSMSVPSGKTSMSVPSEKIKPNDIEAVSTKRQMQASPFELDSCVMPFYNSLDMYYGKLMK